jgi:hypothetical protein
MVWREPTDLSSDCYFCFTNIIEITSKSKHKVKFPDLPSAMRPAAHIKELPVPKLLEKMTCSSDSSDSDDDCGQQEGLMAIQHLQQVVPHLNRIYSHKEILLTLPMI